MWTQCVNVGIHALNAGGRAGRLVSRDRTINILVLAQQIADKLHDQRDADRDDEGVMVWAAVLTAGHTERRSLRHRHRKHADRER